MDTASPEFARTLLLQRLSLALGTSEATVTDAVERAVQSEGVDCSASRLLSASLAVDDVVIFFTVDGISETKAVTVLSERTRADHTALAASGHDVRYLVCYAAAKRRETDAAIFASDHDFEVTSPADVEPQVACVALTARAASLSMPTRSLSSLIHRADANTTTVADGADLIRRGVAGSDIDGAARAAASWLSSVTSELDAEFNRAVAVVFDQLRDSTVDSERRVTCMALSLVEAVLRRLTALTELCDTLNAADGQYQVVVNAGRAEGTPGTDAQSALEQRMVGLRALVDAARTEAWGLLPLLRPLTALSMCDAGREQSLQSVSSGLLGQLAVALAVLAATCPRDGLLVNTNFFSRMLLPLLSADVLTQAEAFLQLPSGVFKPQEEGPSESMDVPAVDSAVAPRCLSTLFNDKLSDAATALARWDRGVSRACLVTTANSFAIHASHVRLQPAPPTAEETDLPATAGVRFASARCVDLQKLIGRIRTEGSGLLPPHVMTLFGTIHRAATQFPLLSAHQYRNWGKFVDVMERSFVLKYAAVDTTIEYREEVAGVVAPEPVAALPLSAHRSRVAAAGGEGDEEKSLLRSRVVSLTAELADSRAVISAMNKRAETAEAAVRAAHEESATLRAELQQLRDKLALYTQSEEAHREVAAEVSRAVTESATATPADGTSDAGAA